MRPGTANTSRPWLRACPAVMSEPLYSSARRHQHTPGQSRDDAVGAWGSSPGGRLSHRIFGEDSALFCHQFPEGASALGVIEFDTTAQNADCDALGFDSGPMCRLIDPHGKPADNAHPGLPPAPPKAGKPRSGHIHRCAGNPPPQWQAAPPAPPGCPAETGRTAVHRYAADSRDIHRPRG